MQFSTMALAPGDENFPLVENFLEWWKHSPHILNHKFSPGALHFFIEDSGWTSAVDVSPEDQDRYWRARVAFPKVQLWPHQITKIHGLVPCNGPEDKGFSFIVSEMIDGNEFLRIRNMKEEAWSHQDLTLGIEFLEAHLVLPEYRGRGFPKPDI
jgi:hypothetical protein